MHTTRPLNRGRPFVVRLCRKRRVRCSGVAGRRSSVGRVVPGLQQFGKWTSGGAGDENGLWVAKNLDREEQRTGWDGRWRAEPDPECCLRLDGIMTLLAKGQVTSAPHPAGHTINSINTFTIEPFGQTGAKFVTR